jgi:hypothetical protein
VVKEVPALPPKQQKKEIIMDQKQTKEEIEDPFMKFLDKDNSSFKKDEEKKKDSKISIEERSMEGVGENKDTSDSPAKKSMPFQQPTNVSKESIKEISRKVEEKLEKPLPIPKNFQENNATINTTQAEHGDLNFNINID